ncbi:probable LRR receptor-like serine/threonine-protein kinase At3g47570 [Eucalyptus grandis]|uniref:probable LRR receptor-like serine/threonine-protein kinase At3g47570 n=1 Tax=Eucalyptus grandis TaxID=71139 RepID=UPI00192EF446|nr:probable LRR receptor-like serine/threonine-protein kinase At3g47570 [Eucalyptus grandis]
MRFVEFQLCHLLLGIALALCFNQVSSTTNETDKIALLAFKAGITVDPFGVLNSWNDSIGFCQWYGVTCGRRHRRVTILDLSSQGLFGSISPHIGNLSFLRKMLFLNNSLDCEIPSQVEQLRHLRSLQLDFNSLVGEIPKNMSSCSNLVTLCLQGNHLTGEIPGELGSLSKLQVFALSGNNLSGSVPSFIGNLSSLEVLHITSNKLGGSIPQVLGYLTNLKVMALRGNRLSGTIPSLLFNLSSLATFEVGGNQILGTLPTDMGLKLPALEYFSVVENQLEGPIPPSISNSTKLTRLQLAINKLSGNVPSFENLHELLTLAIFDNQLGSGKPGDLSFLCSLTNNTKLTGVMISVNKFGGVLPKCIGNLSTTFRGLGIDKNQIFGEIPEEIGNLVNLNILSMRFNYLSGGMPSNMENLQNLAILHLGRNNLQGTIPSSFGNLTKLIQLYLYENNLQGKIPSHLSNCRSLNRLDLSNNNLSGAIPPQLIGLSSLAIILDLSHNHLIGVLPIEVGNLRALTMLDISDNLLGGEIPSSLGDCTSLTELRMGGNFFHGSIPQSIRSLGGIEEMDLSRNNLSGQIPEFLTIFHSLKVLNLSYNKFQGMLPCEGVFKNAIGTSIIGNNELCGGLPEFHLPSCISKGSKRRKINIMILSVSVIFGVLGTSLFLALICLFWLKKKADKPVSSSIDNSCLNLSYGTLLKATDGFSSMSLIGVGSFGSVYRGILEGDGTIVAVKVLHLMHRGALKSFTVECEALKNIRHRNLLKILTVCSSTDYQGNDFKALVYQFMDNGNLEQWLHPNATSSHGNELPKKLNFIWRINIAIDVASALDYLHHRCHIPIVHCDLKPSNVLLDTHRVAHVGDFGLAKFLLGSSPDIVANQMSSMGLRGTIGYAPPEYAMGCEVSREGDVYSYGILLLEMFTGLSPTENRFEDNLTLRSFVTTALPERALEITDHILLLERESHFDPNSRQHWLSESNDIFQECLVTVFNIGVACSNEVPRRRMSIGGVANQLQKTREKLFALGFHEQDELPQDLRLFRRGCRHQLGETVDQATVRIVTDAGDGNPVFVLSSVLYTSCCRAFDPSKRGIYVDFQCVRGRGLPFGHGFLTEDEPVLVFPDAPQES